MKKTYVIGDIHGAYKALIQVLEKSGFDKETDTLISLGDIADGWPETPKCVEELLTIPNRVDIRGNHDDWAYQWLKWMVAPELWLRQGGQATKDAYDTYHPDLKIKHEQEFFSKQVSYYIDDSNRCFVHGGFNRHEPIKHQKASVLMWDRDLFMSARSHDARRTEDKKKYPFKIKDAFKEVFIGHTTTSILGTLEPIHVDPIWNLDTGGGYEGKVTIMDVDTKEFWQSDKVSELYKGIKGR